MWYRAARTIRAFDQDRWDTVAGGEILMTHRWQRVLEVSRRAYRPRYLLIEDLRGPRAAVVLNTSDAFGQTGWQEALLRRLTVQVSSPFCARHCGVALRPGTTLAEVLPTLERACSVLYRRQGQALLSASNVSDEELPDWRAHGYLALSQRAGAVLDLPVSSYEEYLQRLPAKSRQELRRSKRRGAQLGVDFVHGPLADDGEQLYPLVREVCMRHRTPSLFTPELFPALEREMPGEVMVFRGYVRGRLAGFFLALMHGPRLSLPVAGLRYELAYPSYLYFLLTDEMIQWSIAHGVRRVYGGITNLEQKGRHGFQPQARWFCFRASPRPIHQALTAALPLVRQLSGRSAQPTWTRTARPDAPTGGVCASA